MTLRKLKFSLVATGGVDSMVVNVRPGEVIKCISWGIDGLVANDIMHWGLSEVVTGSLSSADMLWHRIENHVSAVGDVYHSWGGAELVEIPLTTSELEMLIQGIVGGGTMFLIVVIEGAQEWRLDSRFVKSF